MPCALLVVRQIRESLARPSRGLRAVSGHPEQPSEINRVQVTAAANALQVPKSFSLVAANEISSAEPRLWPLCVYERSDDDHGMLLECCLPKGLLALQVVISTQGTQGIMARSNCLAANNEFKIKASCNFLRSSCGSSWQHLLHPGAIASPIFAVTVAAQEDSGNCLLE